MTDNALNPWKLATIGILVVLATAAVTALVVTKWPSSGSGQGTSAVTTPARTGTRAGAGGGASAPARNWAEGTPAGSQPAPAPAAAQPADAAPPQAVINHCNRYASAPPSDRDKLLEIGKDALIGGAGTAALGAAAGAIAAGGKGAGKGAAIGGIVGAAAGTLYGINENRKADEEYRTAYAHCMRARGYTS